MYYGGFTYSECRKMSIPYRQWFIERINREMTKLQDSGAPTKAMHDNNPDVNALAGKSRPETPARLRRFT